MICDPTTADSGCPVARGLLWLQLRIIAPGRCQSLVRGGQDVVSVSGSAEGMDAGGDRLLGGCLGAGRMALRCCQPVAARSTAWAGLALLLQLFDPRADGLDPAADLVTAGGRGLPLAAHVISMLRTQAVEERRRPPAAACPRLVMPLVMGHHQAARPGPRPDGGLCAFDDAVR